MQHTEPISLRTHVPWPRVLQNRTQHATASVGTAVGTAGTDPHTRQRKIYLWESRAPMKLIASGDLQQDGSVPSRASGQRGLEKAYKKHVKQCRESRYDGGGVFHSTKTDNGCVGRLNTLAVRLYLDANGVARWIEHHLAETRFGVNLSKE